MLSMLGTLKYQLIAGAVALVGIGLLFTALLLTRADLHAAEAQVASLTTQLTTVSASAVAAQTSATNWQRTAQTLQTRLQALIDDIAAQQERDREAVAQARQAAREADATLAAWLQRYEQATRDEECAAQMRQKLCTVQK